MFTGWVYFRIMDIFSRLYGDRERGKGEGKRMRLVNDKENDDAS